jgi:hypothetical protein
MSEEPSADKWVKQLNDLAREIDDAYGSFHPDACKEMMSAATKKWKKLAQQGPTNDWPNKPATRRNRCSDYRGRECRI